MSDRREGLLLPVAMPVGIVAVIGLVLFGFSRILLAVSHAAATIVAVTALIAVLGIAGFVATRRQVSGSSLFSMVGAVLGVALLAGGLAVVAAPLNKGGEAEAQTVTLAAPPTASVDGFSTDTLEVDSDVPIEMQFDNQESGVQHDVVIFDGDDDKAPTLFEGELVTGPDKATYSIPALHEGSFFFHCEVHPATMVGTITASPGQGGPSEGGGTTIVAQGLKFNTAEIDLKAGAPSTITLQNQDAGVAHNIAIYRDDSLADVLFQGEQVTGPTSVPYSIPALDPGEYYFHCDVHPDMQGTVVVTGGPSGGGGDAGGDAGGG